ncbi:metallophosphoesterase [Candidatus Woesearchaeota archaeon]|nr:metallophosphoesterase [Candidatus Woesearchaeota archaeon]
MYKIKLVEILFVLLLGVILFQLLYSPTDDGYFSVIVLPDTQKYTLNDSQNAVFLLQTRWIVDNIDEYNIKFVVHEGDIVDHADDDWEWTRANSALGILDRYDVPYSLIPGNHDHPTTLYDKYYPASKFSDKEWYGGNMVRENNSDANDNNYQIINVDGEDYIFVSIDVCPTMEEIIWAYQVFANHSDMFGILTTHGYLNENASREVHVCGDTSYIWYDLIKPSKNIRLVLSGHVHAEARRMDYNDYGFKVNQVLADYQERPNGGDGWLRILKFYSNKIRVETFSPLYDTFESDEDSMFMLYK